MPIAALDKDTAKLLTTTQIITSVSNATKELIENALDANARNIDINLTDYGATLIEVKDDGCGISRTDVSCMALPSYTSKITNFSDLELLATYGFRGEALSALSAVADVTIITKTEPDDVAMSYSIDHHGRVVTSEPWHRSTGTTVQVRQLFKMIPVRRQIITNPKKATQDMKVLESLIKSYGICKFFVRMNYRVNNSTVFVKPSTKTMKEAVTYILGKKVTSNMSWIDIEDAETNMVLMIPSREISDVPEVFQSGAQYIFVNHRPIKHKELEKVLIKTILEGLKEDVSSKKRPAFLVHILLDASSIDVNLEPNKTSIFFKEQQTILNTVDKHLKTFYKIPIENIQEEDPSDKSFNYYQDYTIQTNDEESSTEWPACKKRKLEVDKNIVVKEISEACNNDAIKNSEAKDTSNSTNSDNANKSNPHENDMDALRNRYPPPILSESDSNDSEYFTTVHDARVNSNDSANKNTNLTDQDSLPFEFSQNTPAPAEVESLSQLPVVDLGDDFVSDDILRQCDEKEKENEKKNVNVKSTPQDKQKDSKKVVTLEAWSKGHILGLKGGTDVQPYVHAETNESSTADPFNKSFHGSTACKGLILFSRHMRQQVLKENPGLTPPQVALRINDLWRKLSPEERGYYKDLEKDAHVQREEQKKEKKEKLVLESEKNKKRLLTMLEKMKNVKTNKLENLVMRTTVPWDVELKHIAECFLNKPICESTNPIVGSLTPDLWIVNKSGNIWLLDFLRLKKELNISEADAKQDDAKSVGHLLKQWLLEKDDLSILYPIHSLQSNQNT